MSVLKSQDLIEKNEHAPCIWVYKNIFNQQNFIEMIEEEANKDWPYFTWSQSSTGGVEDHKISNYRTSLEMPISLILNDNLQDQFHDLQKLFFEEIMGPIQNCIWDYRESHDLLLKADNGFNLLKYLDGGEYHIHHDHSSDNARVLSLVASLGDDCEGGELEFNHFKFKTKLEKGSVIIFPSNFPYTHIAHPVTSGVKYSLVTWFI